MRFRFDVVLGRAAPQTLTVEAASLNEAKLRLTQQGYSVLSAMELGTPLALGLNLGSKGLLPIGRVSNRELSIFVEQLHALLQAGLSVIESLDTLQRGAHGRWAEVITLIVNQLRQGQTLSNALEHQAIFPALLIALVRSAELTSDLPQALARFLEHQQRSEQVRHQLTSVALYPLLLMSVGGCVILFLLLYVMPRFARVFEGMSNLPWSAQAMVSWSHLLKAHGLDLMIAVGVVVASIASALALPSSRARLFARVLRIQPVARHLRTYFLASWYRTSGMLVEGGIPLPESLSLANQVLPTALQPGGVAVVTAMRQGLAPSTAYIQAQMATPVAEQLLRAGERSGDVGLMLRRAAEFHENEVSKSLEHAMRVIEPLVMTFIGVGVGVVVILMYLPIFELASAVQ
jgi:general secretion pathway protein F